MTRVKLNNKELSLIIESIEYYKSNNYDYCIEIVEMNSTEDLVYLKEHKHLVSELSLLQDQLQIIKNISSGEA